MNKIIPTLAVATALVLVPTFAAHAGGSDSPTPYSVTNEGITLPAGYTFEDNGHVNIQSNLGNKGIHFEALNNQPSGQWIGATFLPWSAFGVDPAGLCVTWVQLSKFNEHHGEGGQAPVGAGCNPVIPPVDPLVDPPTVEICWLLPNGGTEQNVTWPQTYVADCVSPCEQTLQVDRYLASEAPGFYADNVLTQGEDYQSDTQRGAISWRFVVGEACPVVTPPTDTPEPPTATEPPLPVTLASAGPMDAFLTLVIGVFLVLAGLVVLGLIVYSHFYGRIHGPKRKNLNGSAITEEEHE